jgi:hypothetical protein
MNVRDIELDDDFFFTSLKKTFFGNTKAIGEFFTSDEIFVFRKVIFKGHEM